VLVFLGTKTKGLSGNMGPAIRYIFVFFSKKQRMPLLSGLKSHKELFYDHPNACKKKTPSESSIEGCF